MQSVSTQLATTFILLGVILMPNVARAAEVQITEIMYSPSGTDSGHEWVEIYNQSDNSITLTDWRLRENDTNHYISINSNKTVPPDGRAVIADNPDKAQSTHSINPPIFESTFSLNNGGESIGLINPNGTVADSVTYNPDTGADGDGNSLQLSSSGWIAAAPTPAAVNATSPGSDDDGESGGGSSQEDTDSGNAKTVMQPRPEEESATKSASKKSKETVTVDAGSNRSGVAGVQMHLQGVATASDPQLLDDRSVEWSLGNGDIKSGADIFYTYEHPGQYVATLLVRGDEGVVSDQITVSVAEPKLHIADTKSGEDGFITVANSLDRDVNLSGWHLRANGKTATLPAYTIALANQPLKIANAATELDPVGNPELLYPDGTVADRYEPNTAAVQATGTQPDQTEPASSEGGSEGGEAAEDASGVSEPGGEGAASEADPGKKESAATDSATTTSLDALFATGSQPAAVGASQSAGGPFWRWAGLLAVVIAASVGAVVAAEKLTTTKEGPDLLSDTFDIHEM